jgi:hypothetical protein
VLFYLVTILKGVKVMSCSRCVTVAGAAILLTLSFRPVPAFAQVVDLSGQWAAINQSDARTRGPGPDLVDYSVLPLNDEGRAAALSYSYSTISMPERMCMDWSEDYITFAPHAIMIERVDDPVNGAIVAWKISAGGSDRAPMPIWIDGRPHPSPNDLHTFGGFATGQWEGGVLTGHLTHMKRGLTARNGAPLSDQATMTIHVVRHGNILTIMTLTEDPIYLDAPLVQAGTYRLNLAGNAAPVNPPCYPLTEVPRLDVPGTVPHYLPGANPNLETFAKSHNLPLEAVLGGADHIYPEYRKKLKDQYTPPPACKVKDQGRLDCIPEK